MSSHPPVYVGNYEYDADEKELEEAFARYGRVRSIEYKSGFAFVHFEDDRDASDCIRDLDGREWGRQRRRLRVEFAKNDASVRARETARRQAADPNTTLFVAGFDPRTITTSDLQKAFESFGRMKRCEIKRTYAFVEYENVDDAKEALTNMHGRKIVGREVTVEYVTKKPGGDGGRDRDRDRDRGRGRDRSRDRGGRGPPRGGRSRSRSYDRSRGGRGGPGGGGGGDRYRRRSPSYDRGGRGGGRDRSRSPPGVRRGRSMSPRRSPPPAVARGRSRSPVRGRSPVDRRMASRSRSPRM